MERFVFPAALSEEKEIKEEIRQLLNLAENAQKSLWQACSDFARALLSHGERESKVDKNDVKNFVQQMPASASYWSRLEAAFHDTLYHYTLERDPDAIRLDWLKTVRAALRDVWAQHAASVSTGDAWAIRALVRAEGAINKQLRVLNDEIQKYECHLNPQEETA